jgi:hypothetical protein
MIEQFFFAIQDRMNPLHIYCRLRDRGMDTRVSRILCRDYEIFVYPFIFAFTKLGIAFMNLVRSGPTKYRPQYSSRCIGRT